MTNLSPDYIQNLVRSINAVIMESTYPFKPCRIADSNGDMSKPWYVEYYVWSQTHKKLVRKRHVLTQPSAKLRREIGKKVSDQINAQLRQGLIVDPIDRPTIDETIRPETISDALRFYLHFKQKTTKPRTFQTYDSDLKVFSKFLEDKNLQNLRLADFSRQLAYQYLDYLTIDKAIKNRRRNNLKNNTACFFNFFLERKEIEANPFFKIPALPTIDSKHFPFTPDEVAILKPLIHTHDPGLWLPIAFIYYIFIRAGEELRSLKIKNIHANTISIGAASAKNSTTEHVLISQGLEEIITEAGLRKMPPDWYVFGHGGPGPVKAEKNHWYRRHYRILELAHLTGKNHDFYGWKHTGMINLYLATNNIELCRRQARHKDIATTLKYIRELGIFTDYTEINKFPKI